MKPFSQLACTAMFTVVLLSAGVSWFEGTFTGNSVTMGFLNHGGMWGDLFIVPIVAGQIVPHIRRDRRLSLPIGVALVALSAIITIVVHQRWDAMGEALGTTDHVFPSHEASIWYRDLSLAGYLHVIYMSAVLALVLAYSLVPVPRSTVLLVSGLLTIHVVLGQVQPAWYSTGTISEPSTIIPTTITVLLVWIVGAWKIRRVHRAKPV